MPANTNIYVLAITLVIVSHAAIVQNDNQTPNDGQPPETASIIGDGFDFFPPHNAQIFIDAIHECRLTYIDQQIRMEGSINPAFYSFMGTPHEDGTCGHNL